MKRTISSWAAAALFVGALALTSAQATPAPQTTHNKTVEITGCFSQGPVAKEYLLRTSDGTTWGVTSADKNMYMNDYVGQTVTVTGDTVHPKAHLQTVSSEQNSPAINHHVRAMDVVVESQSCQK